MSDSRSLAEAKNPDGSRRFYAPGEHPATARLLAGLARVEHLQSLAMEPEMEAQAAELIGYYRRQLARFEWGEDRAKREYLSRMVSR